MENGRKEMQRGEERFLQAPKNDGNGVCEIVCVCVWGGGGKWGWGWVCAEGQYWNRELSWS